MTMMSVLYHNIFVTVNRQCTTRAYIIDSRWRITAGRWLDYTKHNRALTVLASTSSLHATSGVCDHGQAAINNRGNPRVPERYRHIFTRERTFIIAIVTCITDPRRRRDVERVHSHFEQYSEEIHTSC